MRAQLDDERHHDDAVAMAYVLRLKTLLQAASAPWGPPSYCCRHHESKFRDLQRNIGSGLTQNLRALLELAPSGEILAQLRTTQADLEAASVDGRCVKLLRLDAFVSNNLRLSKNKSPVAYTDKIARLKRILSPNLPSIVRMKGLQTECPELQGELGNYPSVEGCSHVREFFCDQTLIFGTFRNALDALKLDRNEAPDDLLLRLGLTFLANETWLEVTYPLSAIAVRSTEVGVIGAVPSAIEARGYWPFKVDRCSSGRHGYTRNLRDGSRGLPEIVHRPIPVSALLDAVIWQKPTECSWGEYAPAYVLKP